MTNDERIRSCLRKLERQKSTCAEDIALIVFAQVTGIAYSGSGMTQEYEQLCDAIERLL